MKHVDTPRLALICAGIGAALLLVAGVEGVLRLLDVGAEQGLFTAELAPDGSRIMRLFWNPQFHRPQPPAAQRQFLAEKPPASFRIFVVGESSAEGTPYDPGLAFSSWLERRLRAQVPDVRWEVVNAALAGAQSGSMLTMVRDIARRDPDLLVVYLGHDELGGQLTAEERARLDPDRFDLRRLLARLHLYRIVARALPGPAKQLRLLDSERAPSASPENYASAADGAVIERLYRARIGEMVRLMRGAGARTALLTLSQNFADWSPVVSVHRSDLRPQENAAWQAAVDEGDAVASATAPQR